MPLPALVLVRDFHFSTSCCLLLPSVVLDPGEVPKHLRQGLVGERSLCPCWVFLSKTGSSLQDRDGIHQQMTQDTGVTEQGTGKQRQSENYLLC